MTTFTFRPDCCVAATWITIETLKYFGIAARPQACSFEVYNRAFEAKAAAAGRMPETREELREWTGQGPGGPWSVGIFPDAQAERPGFWNGHLVAITAGGYVVDASADQANRPEYGIVLPGVVILQPDRLFLDGERYPVEAPGVTMIYRMIGDERYRKAVDWNGRSRALREKVCGRIIRAMRKEADGLQNRLE